MSYDSSSRPFLYSGEMPPHGIAPLMRVVRVGDRAWPFSRLREAGTVSEAGVTINWEAGKPARSMRGRLRKAATWAMCGCATRRVRTPHDVLFAFHAFWPDGEWMLGR